MKRRSAGNFFLKRAKEYFFVVALVIKGLIIWEKNVTKNYSVVSDVYVKYERAEVLKPAIMQDFRDSKEKNWNGRLAAILDFISAKFVMGYHCVRPTILFYIYGPAILHFLTHLNITKLLKFKMAAKRPFLNFCSQKGIRSLSDIAEHICQMKKLFPETW